MRIVSNDFRSTSIRSSIIYFLLFAAIAAILPFLALYYGSLGFSGGQIGLLLSISPLVTLFASPFWTGLADAGKRHWTVLVMAIVAAAGIMTVFPIVRSFPLMLSTIILFSFFSAPIMALVDSATLSMLGDQRDLYGRIRIWGTIGWGLSAPLVGVLLQRYGLQWMFWIYALLMILNLVPIRRMEFSYRTSATSFRQGMLSVLADRRWLSVLVMIFVTAIGLTAHTNYMSVLLDEMGATKTLVGIAVAISTIFELPVLFFSNYLLRKFKTQGLLLLAMGVTGLRCILYSFSGSPQVVLAIQCLHGLTFPALWVAGVTYAAENAPEGLGASTQGLLSAVLMGLGAGAGGLIGGLLIDSLGVSGMFGVIGAAVLIGLVVFLIIERFWGSSG